MPKNICPACGQQMQVDVCPYCRAATAIAKPEHAEQAKVTPPASGDGAFSEGLPPVQPVRERTPLAPPKEKATAAGCFLTLICTAVIFGSAVPIVTWRDPDFGQPLPTWSAIAAPLLLGGLCYAVGAGILKLLGIAILRKTDGANEADTD